MPTLTSAEQGWSAIGRLVVSASRPVGTVRQPPAWSPPDLPARRTILLPGREPLEVRYHPGPKGGGRPPVLLLHGMTWSADINFHGLYEPLARLHPLVVSNLPGHGGRPPTGTFDFEDTADELVELLDVMGFDRVIVHGYSLGGLVAAHLALRHRDRVAGLVVAASASSYSQTPRDRLIWRSLAAARPIARLLDHAAVPARIFGYSRRDPEFARKWQWLRAELDRTPMATLVATAAAVSRLDLRGELAALRDVPSAYLVMTLDPVCQPWMQRQFADELDAKTIEVDGDHFLPLTDPEAYAAGVLRALARLERSADARTELQCRPGSGGHVVGTDAGRDFDQK